MWMVPAALTGVRRVCAVRAATWRREGWEEKASGVPAEQQMAPRDREPAGGSGTGTQAAPGGGRAQAALGALRAANPAPHS